MSRRSNFRSAVIPGLLGLCFAAAAFGGNMNRSITIGEGIEADGQSTVNGSISVGRASIISGSLETVNGAITMDDDARARDVETVNGGIRLGSGAAARNVNSVNGSIRLAENVVVEGSVSVVNGKISSGSGSRVAGDISNVNGEIEIDGTAIGGDITTANGDVTLTNNAVLAGNLTIEKTGFWNWKSSDRRKPRVVIGPGSRVVGEILLEREVDLFISDSASVGGVRGTMTMDDAVRFSGEHP